MAVETKKKTGRPTKYSDSILEKAQVFLKECVDEIEEWHKTRGEKSNSFERITHVNLPTVEGLAIYLKVHRDTLYEWSSKHKEFSDTLEQLSQLQRDVLTKKALSGEYSPIIAKLLLSSNHGMAEKTETDITSGGKPIEGFNYVKPDDVKD